MSFGADLLRASARLMEKEQIDEERRQTAQAIREEVKQPRSVMPRDCNVAAGEVISQADREIQEVCCGISKQSNVYILR